MRSTVANVAVSGSTPWLFLTRSAAVEFIQIVGLDSSEKRFHTFDIRRCARWACLKSLKSQTDWCLCRWTGLVRQSCQMIRPTAPCFCRKTQEIQKEMQRNRIHRLQKSEKCFEWDNVRYPVCKLAMALLLYWSAYGSSMDRLRFLQHFLHASAGRRS